MRGPSAALEHDIPELRRCQKPVCATGLLHPDGGTPRPARRFAIDRPPLGLAPPCTSNASWLVRPTKKLQDRVQGISVLDNGVQVVLAPAVGSGLSSRECLDQGQWAAQDPPVCTGPCPLLRTHGALQGIGTVPGPGKRLDRKQGKACQWHQLGRAYTEVTPYSTVAIGTIPTLAVNLPGGMMTKAVPVISTLPGERAQLVLMPMGHGPARARNGSQATRIRGSSSGLTMTTGSAPLADSHASSLRAASPHPTCFRWSEPPRTSETMFSRPASKDLDQHHLQAAWLRQVSDRPLATTGSILAGF